MTTAVNVEKGLEVAKAAMIKFNEVALPWIQLRIEEAKPVAIKLFDEGKTRFTKAEIFIKQRMG